MQEETDQHRECGDAIMFKNGDDTRYFQTVSFARQSWCFT